MHSICRAVRRPWLAAALLFVVLVRPDSAAADGALAVGQPSDVAADGFAYGFALDQATPEQASANALRDCKSESPGVDPRAQALCAVVRTFKNQCFAVAMDPEEATPGVGWAIERDKDSAARGALARCVETAGEGRRDACEVTHSGCDGDAK